MESGNNNINILIERIENQSPSSELEDDIDSDISENSDDIDEEFYRDKKQGNKREITSSPKQLLNSRPSSPPSNITTNTITTPPTRTKRMSMVRPISHHLPDFVIDEKDNSDFLNELTFMIAEFPVPPSHLHPIEPFPKNSRNTGGSFISFGGWTASPNANSRK